MDIEFTQGDGGFYEALALVQIARLASERDPSGSDMIQLLDQLVAAGEAHCARPEFAELRAHTPLPVVESGDDSWWRGLFGPSRREVLLSEQRIAALERAARAERSSFEAVAENARLSHACADLEIRVAELEARLAAGPQRATDADSK